MTRPELARQYAADAVIAAVVITLQLLGSHAAMGWHKHAAAPGIAAYLVLAAGGVSLLVRRRYPVAVLAITLASALTAAELSRNKVTGHESRRVAN